MDLNRRSFLGLLGLAPAAAIIKPKSFFSFFGTGQVWGPPEPVVQLEASIDGVNWTGVSGLDFFTATPLMAYQHTPKIGPGLVDRLLILTHNDWRDVRYIGKDNTLRYLRLAPGSPEAVLTPIVKG